LLRQQAVQFLERVFLFLRQLLRDGDAGDGIEVSMTATVHVRHALAAQLEPRSRLCAGWHLHGFAAIERRDVNRSSQCESPKADRHLTIQIVVFPLEERLLLHVNDDVEITRRTAGAAMLSFAVESEPLTGRNARWDLDGEFSFAADATRATTRLARFAS